MEDVELVSSLDYELRVPSPVDCGGFLTGLEASSSSVGGGGAGPASRNVVTPPPPHQRRGMEKYLGPLGPTARERFQKCLANMISLTKR